MSTVMCFPGMTQVLNMPEIFHTVHQLSEVISANADTGLLPVAYRKHKQVGISLVVSEQKYNSSFRCFVLPLHWNRVHGNGTFRVVARRVQKGSDCLWGALKWRAVAVGAAAHLLFARTGDGSSKQPEHQERPMKGQTFYNT